MLDVLCPVTVILGTGHLTVRECLALQIQGIVPLTEAAGDDLEVLVGDVPVARGEILVVEDATSIRITEIKSPAPIEVSQ